MFHTTVLTKNRKCGTKFEFNVAPIKIPIPKMEKNDFSNILWL